MTLSREFREWMRDWVVLLGYCPWCHAEVVTRGPRGGRKWEFAHEEGCLGLRVYRFIRSHEEGEGK